MKHKEKSITFFTSHKSEIRNISLGQELGWMYLLQPEPCTRKAAVSTCMSTDKTIEKRLIHSVPVASKSVGLNLIFYSVVCFFLF